MRNQRLESRVRENRTHGSEGGEAKAFPIPYRGSGSGQSEAFGSLTTWMTGTSPGTSPVMTTLVSYPKPAEPEPNRV